jgi:hypothetical protein
VSSMLHSFMSFSAILLWSPTVGLLRYCISFLALDICCDSFPSLLWLRLLCQSLPGFSVGVLCRHAYASLFYLILLYRSFTSFYAVVVSRDSFISFSNLCFCCFASFLVHLLSCRHQSIDRDARPSVADQI